MSSAVKVSQIEQYVIEFVMKLRAEKNLTQEDVGNIIGVKQPFIASVENTGNKAKYNLDHINLLADHFGLSPKDFLPDKALL